MCHDGVLELIRKSCGDVGNKKRTGGTIDVARCHPLVCIGDGLCTVVHTLATLDHNDSLKTMIEVLNGSQGFFFGASI